MDGSQPARAAVPQQMDIPGFGGRYYVRIDGTVWRRWKSKDSKLHGTRNRRNWDYKLTRPDGRTVCKAASAIMHETYFSHLPEGTPLKHRDGQTSNWAYWNLQPITKRELGRETHASLDARRILKVDPKTGDTVAIFTSSREAGRAAYCSYQTILDACNRKNKKRPGIAPDGYRYSWEKGETSE